LFDRKECVKYFSFYHLKIKTMTNKSSFLRTMTFIALVATFVACNNAQSDKSTEESKTTMSTPDSSATSNMQTTSTPDSTKSAMSAKSTNEEGLKTDPTTLSKTATRECLTDWRGCGYLGSRQATYNVRPDGTWEFSVNYCCNYQRCYKTGTGASTAKGSVSHEEYSLSSDGQCLELINRQRF
jgi:hypothetical protein